MRPMFCRLARPDLKIPMPGGVLFSERGETVDAENSFIRRLIEGGDIVESQEPATESTDATDAAKPAKRKG